MTQLERPHFAAASAEAWQLRRPFSLKLLVGLFLAVVALGWSYQRLGLSEAISATGGAVGHLVGVGEESKVVQSAGRFFSGVWPLAIATQTPVNRVEGYDADNLPWLAHVETVTQRRYDASTESWREESVEVLVRPVGYLTKCVGLMLQTMEMAVWGTLLSVAIGLPLGCFGASNYTARPVYAVARALACLLRSIPELILALILVLMYGFGPAAGVLALGLHTSGFLGKFFADDIENAPRGPQEALRHSGAGRFKVLRFAVLPDVLPQYAAYIQYILERNVRYAAVLGIVGAGGIGFELKGRWDMFEYGHVATILLCIFLTVYTLERATQWLRRRLIGV